MSGVSSGIAICLVPPFLSAIARASPQLSGRSGQVGTLHQMAIVIGLFMAQAAGMIFTGSVSHLFKQRNLDSHWQKGNILGNWRYITAVSGIVSILQILTSSRIYSPDSGTGPTKTRRDPEDGLSPVPEQDEGVSLSLCNSDSS